MTSGTQRKLAMMDRIETFQDLMDILDRHPEWAQALREKLLTPELLALPEKFAAFAEMVEERFKALETEMTQVKADVAELKTHMVQVKADVAELKTDMVQVKADVAELKTDMVQVKTDVGELKGHATPTATRRMTGTIMQAANIRRPKWMDTDEITEISEDAEETGQADIPSEHMESFRNIDLALRAVDKTTGQPCFVIIECSYTLTRHDVDRVQRNAEYMNQFTGTPCKALASATVIREDVELYAAGKNVTCVTISSKAAAPR